MDTNAMKKSAAAGGATNTALAKAEKKPLAPSVLVGNMIGKYQAEIAQALPSVITPERFTRLATNAIATNPKMVQAVTESPRTFIGALMTCAQLGIEPNTPLGQGYLLPFYNYDKVQKKKVMQVSFQLGVFGVIDLARRSGEVAMIQAHEVYDDDEFDYGYGLDPWLTHKPAKSHKWIVNGDRPEDHVTHFYGMYKTKSGNTDFVVMSKEEVIAHAKRFSKSYDTDQEKFFGPWETDFIAMGKKTVLLAALKYAPKKSDFSRAISADNSVKSTIAKDMSEVQNEVIEAEVVSESGSAESDGGEKPSDSGEEALRI